MIVPCRYVDGLFCLYMDCS
uniref:Uncharacterized protein n=1 Tax=Arundo donax TaxID=35708 RepID=A0A0A9F747_ARUDO